MRSLRVVRLGLVSYGEGLERQEALVRAHHEGHGTDTLLLLEHEPVITLGRDGKRDNVLHSEEDLRSRGVALVETDRGGDATFHGPGQLVAYPILDLRPDWQDLRRFVGGLERTMIDTLSEYGLEAAPLSGFPGVWLSEPDRKIGALGARVRRWITNHGLALNVNTDLDYFSLIVPCGIRDRGVTSIARELGGAVDLDAVGNQVAEHLARVFGRTLTE